MAKLQRERAENVAMAALLVQVFMGLVAFWMAKRLALTEPTGPGLVVRWPWAPAVFNLGWYLVLGVGFWLMTWVHLRQLRLAEQEAVEWRRLTVEREAGGARGRLFEEDEIAAHVHRNRLRLLEKYVLPGASLTLLILMAALGWWLFPLLGERRQELGVRIVECPFSAAMMVLVAMGCFLLGMFASGMSRQREWRPLRAGAGYMMSSAALAFVTLAGLAVASFGPEYLWLVRAAAYAAPAVLLIVSVEILLNFVLDFYRPRIEGVEYRPSYDSRVLGMLAEPGGIFRTVASTLDYQFGFKVSETWFYQFLERALAPLFLFTLVTLYLLTCVVVIGPGEQAVIEVFGEPATYGGTSAVFGPGIYLKWPWPIAKTYRYDAESVQRMNVGFDEEAEKEKASKGHKELKRFLWTMKHYEKEYYVMVAVPEKAGAHGEAAVPVGLIVPTGSMFWKVKNLYDFWYNKKDPERVLRDIAYRELHVYFAGVDFFDVMGPGRERASEALRQAVQKAADEERLGVEICRFCLDGVHPPIEEEMGQAFQAVVSAEQEKQAEIYRGEAYAGERKVTAQHEAGTLRVQAHKERAERRERARGEVSRQQGQWAAYQAAPRVYKMQYYLDELTQALQEGKTRKFLVAAKDVDHEVLHLNVEDQVRLSPADVALEETPSK